MEDQIILLDTSILIDYYRKTNKHNSAWFDLIDKEYKFVISVITKYELLSGAATTQAAFWNSILASINILPFNENCVDTAVQINLMLKRKSKQIDLADLFIAATAMTNDLSIATLNKKHFERIEGLKVMELVN